MRTATAKFCLVVGGLTAVAILALAQAKPEYHGWHENSWTFIMNGNKNVFFIALSIQTFAICVCNVLSSMSLVADRGNVVTTVAECAR